MSKETGSKLNQLINQWPRGTVTTTSALLSMGLSNELINKYKTSKWIKAIGRGACVLYNDHVEWIGGVYALRVQLKLKVHIGGKTALELKGFSHYLPMKAEMIYLYGVRGEKLPSWFKKYNWGVKIIYTTTNLFPTNCTEGFSEYEEKEFSIKISSPEKAALEMLYHVPFKVGFEEAYLIMENLPSLRPKVIEELLKCCNSVKVKRLFMYMGEKHHHPWVEEIDVTNIDFGKGKRVIVKSGVLNKKYNITAPRDIEGKAV